MPWKLFTISSTHTIDQELSHMPYLVVSNAGNSKLYLGGYVSGKTQGVLLVKKRIGNRYWRTINSFYHALVLTAVGVGVQGKVNLKVKSRKGK